MTRIRDRIASSRRDRIGIRIARYGRQLIIWCGWDHLRDRGIAPRRLRLEPADKEKQRKKSRLNYLMEVVYDSIGRGWCSGRSCGNKWVTVYRRGVSGRVMFWVLRGFHFMFYTKKIIIIIKYATGLLTFLFTHQTLVHRIVKIRSRVRFKCRDFLFWGD